VRVRNRTLLCGAIFFFPACIQFVDTQATVSGWETKTLKTFAPGPGHPLLPDMDPYVVRKGLLYRALSTISKSSAEMHKSRSSFGAEGRSYEIPEKYKKSAIFLGLFIGHGEYEAVCGVGSPSNAAPGGG